MWSPARHGLDLGKVEDQAADGMGEPRGKRKKMKTAGDLACLHVRNGMKVNMVGDLACKWQQVPSAWRPPCWQEKGKANLEGKRDEAN